MTRFHVLYCRRSDGTVNVLLKGKRQEPNQPTDEQLDQRPDKNGVSDYYREVDPDEPKHLDWRRKLGGMLARELDWKDKNGRPGTETGYMLVAFPENYRLYEHIKKVEKDGKTEVKNKTHAAGGNERQDAYLYGHPEGRRKRYRSPGDFFPHLLWLCTDESGDPENCGCKICSPDDLDEPLPAGKTKFKQELDIKSTSAHSVAGPSKQGNTPFQANAQLQRPLNSPRQLVSTPLPPAHSADERIDRQYTGLRYRPGELLWFSRGQAWGLGAVLRRWMNGIEHCYSIQPLNHPFSSEPAVTKSSYPEIRPWLSWSVPSFSYPGLNTLREPPRYETADWHGMMSKRYGEGSFVIDGSILAAKMVDATYTPINPTNTLEVEPGTSETYYDGLFLGAEKIWVGDPVRLQSGSGGEILVVHSIIERKRAIPLATYLVGDVYQLQTIPHGDPKVPPQAAANNNPQLPQRLTEELAFWNGRSIAMNHVASHWKLIATQKRVELNDIRGRWYEASLLLPGIDMKTFQDSIRSGHMQQLTRWMNARGDCINANRSNDLPQAPRQNYRKETRREAFGQSMPANAEIKDGTEPPLPENVDPALDAVSSQSMDIDPRFDTADDSVGDEIHASRPDDEPIGGGIDDFMNLDGMEDSQSQMPGFGQEYGSQSY